MPVLTPDVLVIGGGPAGMSAAIAAAKTGAATVIVERNDSLGGILPQCIHNGFGALNLGKDLPGPEYARHYEKEVRALPVEIYLDTTVTDLQVGDGAPPTSDGGAAGAPTTARGTGAAGAAAPPLTVFAMNASDGYLEFRPRAVVLAMGCRERTRSQIRLPGTRAAGIYTAGTAQRLVNIEGWMPGKRIVVLGSGDIGMIMARRLTIEGADVLAVLELLPFLTGLRRNYVQCLQDYDIPLHLSTTVTRIIGHGRVEAIEVASVDESRNPIPDTERTIEADTLVLSVGLIPENELSRAAGVAIDPRTNGPLVDNRLATSVPGVFAAGNVTAIHDLADWVSRAGDVAGANAADWAVARRADGENPAGSVRAGAIAVEAGNGIAGVVPQRIDLHAAAEHPVVFTFRVTTPSEERVRFVLRSGDDELVRFGEPYGRPAEMVVHELSDRQLAALKEAAPDRLTLEVR